MSIPQNLKYTASHEWVRDENDGTVTIGITEHAQDLLGDIVFVELPELARLCSAGEGCSVIESVKAAADVYAPVAGEVVAVNTALTATPELVNNDPYGEGWLYRLRVDDNAGLEKLLSADTYQQTITNE